jgi:hypothetical protein
MPSPTPPNNSRTPIKRLTYQPFLLAIATLALVSKVVLALATSSPIVDWFFVIVLVVFLVAAAVYVWEKSRVPPSKQQVTISTGSAKGSKIAGVKTNSTPPHDETVSIETKDVTNSEITGVERKERG